MEKSSRPFFLLHRQSDHPLCPSCHYDLTGNLSGRCPECGNLTPAEEKRLRQGRLAELAQSLNGVGMVEG